MENALVAQPRTLADLIESTRLARNLTPAEASRQIGVQPTQFSRWRRGLGGISMDHLDKLATWLDVPLGELQPLAGYPSANGSATAPRDPRLAAINAVWDRLSEARRGILHEIAQAHRNEDVTCAYLPGGAWLPAAA